MRAPTKKGVKPGRRKILPIIPMWFYVSKETAARR